jgi:hypothetical protein
LGAEEVADHAGHHRIESLAVHFINPAPIHKGKIEHAGSLGLRLLIPKWEGPAGMKNAAYSAVAE